MLFLGSKSFKLGRLKVICNEENMKVSDDEITSMATMFDSDMR